MIGDLDVRCSDEDDDGPWSDEDGLDPRTADPKQVRVSIFRPISSTSLRDTGLAALGRFAYTAEETVERLALIERALSELPAGSPGRKEDALCRAQRKLRGWAFHLEREDT